MLSNRVQSEPSLNLDVPQVFMIHFLITCLLIKWNFGNLLRRYDTIKISLNFPELFIIGKYVKIMFKNMGSPCYFLSSRGQKIKNITKIK